LNAGGANPSLVVGAANGDMGDLILSSGGASVLETRVTSVGEAAGSTGILTVDNLQWNGTGNIRVGHQGTGTLTLQNGSDASTVNGFIGNQAGSTGEVNVVDNATWTASGEIAVGRFGEGEMTIDFFGSVTSASGVLGEDAAASGTVFVNNNAAWTIAESLTVGEAGSGLFANTRGDVVCHDAFIARLPGSAGAAHTSNNGTTWTVTGRLSLAGDAFTGAAGGNGFAAINPGALVDVAEDIVIFPDGEFDLNGGALDSPIITVEPGGAFNWAGGELFVDTFDGNLTNNGGTLAARVGSNSMLVTGEYLQLEDGTLSIEIAGDAASNQYDLLIVGNSAFLGGTLEVELAGSFAPSPGDVYAVVDALSFGAGSFDNVANGERLFDASGRGSFLVNYGVGSPFDPSQVVLSDFRPALSADFDGDGDVDGADLTEWRNDFGPTAGSDADGDGDSDGADFLAWQQQVGSGLPLTPASRGALAPAAIPEPAAAKIAGAAGAMIAFFATDQRRRPSARGRR
jgi:T5SS/PEP-CTERM-associated repeat protein